MGRIVGEEIDLVLAQKFRSGMLHRFDLYYYDIVLHNTNQRIGYIDLRVGHSEYLYYLGNIGYRIFEEHRGHYYAYKACLLVFDVAMKMGLSYLIITCDPQNVASNKTLKKLNGSYLGVKRVPMTHALFMQGDRYKCVYRYDLVNG